MKSRNRLLKATLLGLTALAIAAPAAQAMPLIGASSAVTTPPQIRALALRSQGMNALYGPAQTRAAVTVSTAKDGFNWTDGALGAAGVFAAALVVAVAIVVTRRNHHAPLGV